MSGRRIHLEDLFGRQVVATDGTVVGRIEEVRAERHGDDTEVTEYLLGPGALVERLHIARRALRGRARMVVARWDQIDVTRPRQPRLTCAVDELKVEEPRGR